MSDVWTLFRSVPPASLERLFFECQRPKTLEAEESKTFVNLSSHNRTLETQKNGGLILRVLKFGMAMTVVKL